MKNAVVIWLWLCAWLNCAGWFLSAIHELNALGYAVILAVGIAALLYAKKSLPPEPGSSACGPGCWKKFVRRFKRSFPLAFLILSAMAFVGGALHAPSNYDGLAYRVPRVLHWLAAGQWHWIHTTFPRVNARACGMEWISAPLIALFKTDRLLFLINIISSLFLPGLIFSVLTRLGVRRRVAWHWMWIVPTGYCFLLQAGSIANDAFAAPFALAAIDLALRARASRRPRDLFSSILAAALLTSAKTGNMTLLLPWAIAILPSLKYLLRRPLATVTVCIMAVFSSFLPTAALNYHFCHDWSGLSLENLQRQPHPALRTVANVVLTSVLNLTPPVFPEAARWNSLVQKKIPAELKARLHESFTEPQAAEFQTTEMQIEENAALGFGVTLLLLASVIVALGHRGKTFPFRFNSSETLWRAGVILSPWVSTLALLTQSGVYPIGRILAPNYPLLLPFLLLPAGHEAVVKKCWWRIAALVVFAMAAGLLVISPARPLFPVQAVLQHLQTRHPDSKPLARMEEVYSVYRDRNHAFAPALDILPPGLKVLGLITYDDPETSLWKPFGSRRVIYVCPDDSAAYLKAEGVEYILTNDNQFGTHFPALDVWLNSVNGMVVQKIRLNLRASGEDGNWTLMKLN